MDNALKEILHDVMIKDWHIFKDLKGMEIAEDIRFHNFLRVRKYSPYQFKYAISPLKKKDFLELTVMVYIAIDTNEESSKIAGFSIWAYNTQLEEYDMLVYLYVFSEFRRNKIAKKLISCHQSLVILPDEGNNITRNLLSTYFREKVVFGIKDSYKWVPENGAEQKRLNDIIGEVFTSMESTFDNFMFPKL